MSSNMRTIRNLGSVAAFAGLALLLVVSTTNAQKAAGPEIRFTAASASVAQPGDAVKINLIRWSSDEERAAIVASMTAPPARGGGRGARGGARGAAPDGPADPAALADPTDPFGTFRGGQAAAPPPAAAPAAAARGAFGGGPRGEAAGPFNPVVSLGAAIGKAPTIGYLWTSEVTGYPIKYAYRSASPDGSQRVILALDRQLGAFSAAWKPAAGGPDYPFTVIEMRLAPKVAGEGKTSLNTKVMVDAEAKTIALENFAATPATLKNVK